MSGSIGRLVTKIADCRLDWVQSRPAVSVVFHHHHGENGPGIHPASSLMAVGNLLPKEEMYWGCREIDCVYMNWIELP
jgi:hypothetical protein